MEKMKSLVEEKEERQRQVRESRLQQALQDLDKPRARSNPKRKWNNPGEMNEGKYEIDIKAYEEFKSELDEYLAQK